MPPSRFDVNWLQVQPQRLPGCQSQQWWAKDIRLDWPTVISDDFLYQLLSVAAFLRLAVQCWRALEAIGEV